MEDKLIVEKEKINNESNDNKKEDTRNRKKNDLLDVAIGIIKSIYLPSKPQGATDVRLLGLLIENDFFSSNFHLYM